MTASAPNVPLGVLGIRTLWVVMAPEERAQAAEDSNPLCMLRRPDSRQAGCVRWLDFVGDNADGIGAEEAREIFAVITAGRVWYGGGGAAERWSLEVVG